MNLLRLHILLLLLTIPVTLFSNAPPQVKNRPASVKDSLSVMLVHAEHDSDRCRLNIQIGNTLIQASPDSAMVFYRRALLIAQPNLDHGAEKEVFRRFYSSSLRNLGNANFYLGNYDPAISFYKQALGIFEELKDRKGMLMCFNNLGLVSWKKGTYDTALEYYLKSLSICEESGDTRSMAAIQNNIGLIHWEMGNMDVAAGYFLRALAMATKLNNKALMSDALNNIGLVTWEKKNYDSAIRCYQGSLQIKKELNDPKGISSCYTNIGLVYNDKGEHDKAIGYYQQALAAIQGLEDKNEIALINGNIASAHLSSAKEKGVSASSGKDHLQKAVVYGERAYVMAVEIGSWPLQNSSAATLLEVWKSLGDYRKATEYAEKYIATRDSMFSDEKTKALTEMDARYTIEKKQLEINRLLKERDLQHQMIAIQENRNRAQRIMLLVTVSGVALITIFSIIIVVLYANKRKVHALLQVQKAEIEEKNLTKDKLFSIISHDLRNPFNTILGFCDLLVRETGKVPANKELQRIASILQGASHQANNLLTGLLEWSMLQTQRLTPRPEPVSVKELAGDMMSLFGDYAKEKRITFSNEVTGDQYCISDKEMARTVLRNLVSNAIKFTRPDGRVSISSEVTGNSVTVTVDDTGIGLTQDQSDELFKLKKNIATRGTADEKGTGLGLIICKEFIEANGGTFRIDSQPGKGTRSSFILPRAETPEAALKPDHSNRPGSVKIKILVAEDDESNLLLLTTILTRENYDVISVSNGESAMEAIRKQPDIRLALIDLGMPGMDGFELLKQIRQYSARLPVVAQTGRNFPEEIRKIQSAGFNSCLTKPIDKKVLLRTVSEQIRANQS